MLYKKCKKYFVDITIFKNVLSVRGSRQIVLHKCQSRLTEVTRDTDWGRHILSLHTMELRLKQSFDSDIDVSALNFDNSQIVIQVLSSRADGFENYCHKKYESV